MTFHRGDFRARLESGAPVLLDGALGTELERRGVDCAPPAWSARAIDAAPTTLAEIHTEYALAGAEVLTACTFRTHARALERAGIAGRDRLLTQLAVDLAREAAGNAAHPVWVAGSVAPLEDCFHPELAPSEMEMEAEHARHAANLRFAGVDFAALETMGTAREAVAALRCAREAGLAAGVSFVLRDPEHLLGGHDLGDAVARVAELGPLYVGVNCNAPGLSTGALRQVRRHWDGPAAVYANLGRAADASTWRPGGDPADTQRFRTAARAWVREGARMIGGCCGTAPALIAALRRDLRAAERGRQ
ncbi:MAG: homocysteine S-methyltransferase family protein [Candidatus Eisenbacteria bacterium]|nr:homocysteine S-methyltransferase family protein [Candidatus Eisenbacteria bacterium]